MTRHDGEHPEPDAGTEPTGQPPARSEATETTGTWAFISPFAASPGSYVPSSASPVQPTSDLADQPTAQGTGPAPTAAFGRPDWGPAGQPEWGSTLTGPAGGEASLPGARPSPTPNEPPTWGGPAAARNEPPTWGAPAAPDPGERPPSRWKTWQKATAGGVLAAVVAIGAVAAVSAASASSNGSATSQAGFAGGGGFAGSESGAGSGRAGGGGAAGVMALANALHGDFVVSSGTGTQAMRLQTGELTAVASDSITVASTDGYTSTYAIGSGVDVAGLTQGTTVRVLATVDGDIATATSVTSGTGGFGGGAGQGQSGQGQGGGGSGMQPLEGMQPPQGLTPPDDSDQAPPTS